MNKYIPRFVIVVLIVLVLTGTLSAFSAANIVPATRLGQQIQTVTANTLKPAECAALDLTRIVICTGGVCNGSNANELMLGTAGPDDIKGKNGDDCILGGGGDDDISGDNGTDVCIGGPGTDTFKRCETEVQ